MQVANAKSPAGGDLTLATYRRSRRFGDKSDCRLAGSKNRVAWMRLTFSMNPNTSLKNSKPASLEGTAMEWALLGYIKISAVGINDTVG
jgi:hypothetical protein